MCQEVRRGPQEACCRAEVGWGELGPGSLAGGSVTLRRDRELPDLGRPLSLNIVEGSGNAARRIPPCETRMPREAIGCGQEERAFHHVRQ